MGKNVAELDENKHRESLMYVVSVSAPYIDFENTPLPKPLIDLVQYQELCFPPP